MIALWGCLLAVGSAGALGAQPPEGRSAPTEESQPAAESGVKEVQPPVLFLRNKEGGLLQAVLGFTLEDFERFMAQRAQLGLGQQPPRYQMERVTARGRAADTHVELSVECVVVVNDRGWVRIPLRLAEGILRDKPRYEGPGEQRVELDPTSKEHVLWLRGGGEESHKITLDLVAPLEQSAEQTVLKLGFPRAPLARMTLLVPVADAVGRVRDGGVLDETKHLPSGAETEFDVLGMEPSFAISWRNAEVESPEVPTLLEASGLITARVDGAGVRSDVQLTLRSFGTKFETARLRLPAGTTLSAKDEPNYTLEPIEDAPAAEDRAAATLYEVRLREKSTGPVVVRFSTDRPHGDGTPQPRFAIAGVELVGAARQWGYVAVRANEDWQVAWGELRQARQVEELPPEVDREGLLAGFEYFGQPWEIAGEVTPLECHVSATPDYKIEVDARQLHLTARLKYQVWGAKAFALDVALAGWELDDVAPRTTFDVDRMTIEPGKSLKVPLLQPQTGAIEVQLVAHRALPADTTLVDVTLPKAVAENLRPGQLTIIPAGNVILTARKDDLEGLSLVAPEAQPETAPATSPKTLLYRTAGDGQRFVADLQIEARRMSAELQSRITLGEAVNQVDETIVFTIAHEAVGELLFDVPAWLNGAGQVQWQLDGQAVVPTAVEGDGAIERSSRYRLPLAERRTGTARVTLSYPLPRVELSAQAETPVDVGLVLPVGSEITKNSLTVVVPPTLAVAAHDARWTASNATAAQDKPIDLQLTSEPSQGELTLAVKLADAQTADPLVVERCWVQTRLSGGERWDRAVFEFSGGGPRLPVTLPAGALGGELRALLDGVAVSAQSLTRSTVLFDVPTGDDAHVLDVSYRFGTREPSRGRLQLAAPLLGEDPWVRQTYWQLVLPRDEHLVHWPTNLTGAFQWRIKAGLWGREPLVEQPRLEAWIGATHGPDVPEQTNRYVFTALGPVASLDVYTAGRALIVLFASGGVMLLGLLLLYVPVLRNPALFFVVGIGLVVGAVLYPEAALLLTQVAALGLTLVVVAAILDRWLQSRRPAPLVMRSSSSSILEPGSTRTHLRQHGQSPSSDPVPLMPQAAPTPGES